QSARVPAPRCPRTIRRASRQGNRESRAARRQWPLQAALRTTRSSRIPPASRSLPVERPGSDSCRSSSARGRDAATGPVTLLPAAVVSHYRPQPLCEVKRARCYDPPVPSVSRAPKFAALHVRDYRRYFIVSLFALTADNIEHVISYWVIFRKFHSPALG